VVELGDDDLRRLREQRWDRHLDYRGVRITRRKGWLDRRRVLAHRDDDACVFLSLEGLCRIHQQFGEAAKPLHCRLYPFLRVPEGEETTLTVRRGCPSAVLGRGRPLAEHLPHLREIWALESPSGSHPEPPPIAAGLDLDWPATSLLLERLEQLMADSERPLAGRFRSGLELCRGLEVLAAESTSGGAGAGVEMRLEALSSAAAESRAALPEPMAPSPDASDRFRQIVLEYLLFLPPRDQRPDGSGGLGPLRSRLRTLRAAFAFHRGRGWVPRLARDQPDARFEELERPLGSLEGSVERPIEEHFLAAFATRSFALPGRRAIVDSFRRQALAFAVIGWLLRALALDREPSVDRVVAILSAVNWRHDTEAFSSAYHADRLRGLAASGGLDDLVAWYGR
jgi:lysine-N-methylase